MCLTPNSLILFMTRDLSYPSTSSIFRRAPRWPCRDYKQIGVNLLLIKEKFQGAMAYHNALFLEEANLFISELKICLAFYSFLIKYLRMCQHLQRKIVQILNGWVGPRRRSWFSHGCVLVEMRKWSKDMFISANLWLFWYLNLRSKKWTNTSILMIQINYFYW